MAEIRLNFTLVCKAGGRSKPQTHRLCQCNLFMVNQSPCSQDLGCTNHAHVLAAADGAANGSVRALKSDALSQQRGRFSQHCCCRAAYRFSLSLLLILHAYAARPFPCPPLFPQTLPASGCTGCSNQPKHTPALCTMRRLTMSFLKEPALDFVVAAHNPLDNVMVSR